MFAVLLKLVDIVLFLFSLTIALSAPLIDAQACLPRDLFPDYLIDLKQWYAQEFGDYLFVERPNFFIGLVWFELIFQWPLSLLNLYGILGAKSWLPTTCLIYGTSLITSMAAVLGELIGSGKAADKMLMTYFPFVGFGVLAILRGLLMPLPGKTTYGSTTVGRSSKLSRKKKA